MTEITNNTKTDEVAKTTLSLIFVYVVNFETKNIHILNWSHIAAIKIFFHSFFAFLHLFFKNDADLLTDTATLLHQLQPERSAHQRAGCESWACTWSGDGSLFAWSCGNHIVKL